MYVDMNNINEAYYNDVRKFPLLTEDEEKQLVITYNNGKTQKERQDAKNKLINSNLRFVISIAKKLGTNENFLDLVNEGNIGLIKAIEKFDINKKYRLVTYAVSWIVAYIKNYQFTQNKIVVPPNTLKLHNYVKNATMDFFNKNEREPTAHEIADLIREKFNFNISNVEDVELGKVISIDEKFTINNDSESLENSRIYTSRTSSNNIETQINEEYKKHQLNFFLGKLNEREKYIVEKVYGIGCEPESFETIGMRLDLCGERVRQLCKSAVKKMNRYKEMIDE
jgi:RNA polymerase primary sigma factor